MKKIEKIIDFNEKSESVDICFPTTLAMQEIISALDKTIKKEFKNHVVCELADLNSAKHFIQFSDKCKILEVNNIFTNTNTDPRSIIIENSGYSGGSVPDLMADQYESNRIKRKAKHQIRFVISSTTCSILFKYNNKKFLFILVNPEIEARRRFSIISDSIKNVEEFEKFANKFYCEDLKGVIEVFSGESTDRILDTPVKMEDVYLEEDKKQKLIECAEAPFTKKDLYLKHGLSPKRGIIFSGYPGNGKTLWAEAYINEFCKERYVKIMLRTYTARGELCFQREIEPMIEARKNGIDCVLVLEELDTLINSSLDRGLILNILDGPLSRQPASGGLLIIGMTNYPKNVDPALINRPSRFDVVEKFDPPEVDQRFIYLKDSFKKRDLALDDEYLEKISEITKGFSYSHLNELVFQAALKTAIDKDIDIREAVKKFAEEMNVSQKEIKKMSPRSAADKSVSQVGYTPGAEQNIRKAS